jgi:SnoaL-like protein
MTPEDLVEIEQIKRLKYRYARSLDTKDWDSLARCFVENATAAYSGGQLAFEGRAAIIDFLKTVLGSTEALTSHNMSQPEIDLTGPDSAKGVWALQDIVMFTEQSFVVRGASFYEDEYVKVDGQWLFRHTGYRRVWEEMAPRAPDAKLTASWWATDGKSQIVAR